MLEAAEYIARDSDVAANRWMDGLIGVMESLSKMPRRCAIAREQAAFEIELRNLIYHSHRIIFTITEDCVRILHVRHAARRDFETE